MSIETGIDFEEIVAYTELLVNKIPGVKVGLYRNYSGRHGVVIQDLGKNHVLYSGIWNRTEEYKARMKAKVEEIKR